MKTDTSDQPGDISCYVIDHQPVYKKGLQHLNFQECGKRNISQKITDETIHLAMAGTYLHTNISYPNLFFSQGPLPGAENAKAAISNDGEILFSWSDNSNNKMANANDKVIIITYFAALKKMVYTLHAATRASGRAFLKMNSMKGYTAQTWIGFASNDERETGDSVYAGSVSL